MTTARLHGKASLDPADYEFLGCFDRAPLVAPDPLTALALGWFADALGDSGRDFAKAERMRLQQAITDSGHDPYQCTHCGARLTYVSAYRHIPTGEAIATGETCSEERLGAGTKEALAMRSLRMARESRAAAFARNAAAQEWIAANETLAAQMITARGDQFISKMVRTVSRWGSLTERQQAATEKAIARVAEWVTPGATCELRAEAIAPEGKGLTIEGEVIKTEARFNDYGERLVMTVKHADGWIAWGTIPANLLAEVGGHEALKGQRVQFIATLKVAEGKTGVAFTSRPRKGVLLAA